MTEAIPTALAHVGGLMDRWRRSLDVFVDNVARELEALSDLTTTEQARVRDAVTEETGTKALPQRLDVYALVNALTGAAHEAEPARRLELEALAGGVLARHVH